jgi:hypothetical protein
MNQPQNQQPAMAAQPAAHYGNPQPQQPMQNSRRSWIPWTILVVVVVIILGVIGYVFRANIFPKKSTVALSGYQAVFLTNGQVYFGKSSHMDSDYLKLTDIYYLQVNQPLQTGGTGTAAQAAAANSANAQTQLSLVKLGNELHGPADEMEINRSQVLFIEDLKSSGQVAQAIVKYQQTNGAAGAASSTPAQGTTQAPAATAPATTTTGTGTAPATTVPATTSGH